jgi:hypothetical protein
MELITILNRCHRFRGFVYERAHFSADKKSIEVAVRPRKGSTAVCLRCHLPAPGYELSNCYSAACGQSVSPFEQTGTPWCDCSRSHALTSSRRSRLPLRQRAGLFFKLLNIRAASVGFHQPYEFESGLAVRRRPSRWGTRSGVPGVDAALHGDGGRFRSLNSAEKLEVSRKGGRRRIRERGPQPQI